MTEDCILEKIERLRKFDADFARLKRNREQVSLEQLRTRYAKAYNALASEVQAGADWYADTYIKYLVDQLPRHPEDTAGNEWLTKRISAIRAEEEKPGGRVERYRAALLDRLDKAEFEQLVWEIYDRIEREAFDPYWQRHNRWTGSPGWRFVYNDIWKKFWMPPSKRNPSGGWAYSDYSGWDSRFPPHIKENPAAC